MKRILSLLTGMALVAAILTGCGGNKPQESASQGGGSSASKDSVVMALSGDISNLNPWDNTVLIDRFVRTNYYETLLDMDGTEFVPLLAEDYSISESGTEYTFMLKKGVKFHNGDELTAEDVVYSIEQARLSSSFSAETAAIEKVEAVDDYTVKVTLSEVNAPFLLSVAAKVCITNKEYMEANGEAAINAPIGTGPYRFVSREAGSKIIMEAFEDWHGGEVAIKNAEFRVVADSSAAVMSLEAGDIDLTYTLPTISVAQLQENSNMTVSMVPTQGSAYLVYNINNAPFDDLNFRKAISYSVDRDTIIAAALDGIGMKSVSIWGPTTVGYTGNYTFPEYDIEKAKEYLAQSNYNGETIQFIVGNDTYKRSAVILQNEWAKLGINVEIVQMESNAWISDMKNGNYQLSLVIHTVEPDADLWSTRFASTGIGISNMSHVQRDDLDELFLQGRSTTDIDERCGYYDEIMKILVDEAIVVPIYYRTMTPAYNANLVVDRFETSGYARMVYMHWK